MEGESSHRRSDQLPDHLAELESEIRMGDGKTLHIRPIRPDDGQMLADFHNHLSDQTVFRRYFYLHPRLSPAEIEHLTHVDYVDRLALVVEDAEGLVAVGRFDRLPDTNEAEVAFVVADRYQRHGLGSLLLQQLADAARERGIDTFTAETMAENRDMIDVFMASGFPVSSTCESGTVTVHFSILKGEGSDRSGAPRLPQ